MDLNKAYTSNDIVLQKPYVNSLEESASQYHSKAGSRRNQKTSKSGKSRNTRRHRNKSRKNRKSSRRHR